MDDYLKKTQELSDIYKREILPVFRLYEPLRAKLHKKQMLSVIALFSAIVLIFVLPSVMLSYLDLDCIYYIATSILLFTSAIVFSRKINTEVKNFKNMLKEQCLDKVLNVFGDIKRVKNPHFDYNEVASSIIFQPRYIPTYDDCFEGVYNGVPFSISEYHIPSGTRIRQLDVRCVLFITKTNKKVGATTVLMAKKAINISIAFLILIFSIGALMFVGVIIGAKEPNIATHGAFIQIFLSVLAAYFSIMELFKRKINLEDTKMQKDFHIESSDQVEARYLITPAFIERFKALSKTFKTKNITGSFYGHNKFMIRMDTKNDFFELCEIDKSLLEPDCMMKFFNEMKVIYDIIDYLKLDEKTGL